MKFINQAWAENVSFSQSDDLPMACARVAKAREVGPLCRLQAAVFLIRVVAVNPVFLAEIVADVHRTLVDIHVRAGGTEKCRRPIKGPIGCRYELQQTLGGGASCALDLSSFGSGQNGARRRQALMLPQSLVAQEKESFPLDDRTADISSELIALQSRLWSCRRVEEI